MKLIAAEPPLLVMVAAPRLLAVLLKLTVPPFVIVAVPGEDVLVKLNVPLLMRFSKPVTVLTDENLNVRPELTVNFCEFVELFTIPALLRVNVPGADMVNENRGAPAVNWTWPTLAPLLLIVIDVFAGELFVKTPTSLAVIGTGLPPQLAELFQMVEAVPVHVLLVANPFSMSVRFRMDIHNRNAQILKFILGCGFFKRKGKKENKEKCFIF